MKVPVLRTLPYKINIWRIIVCLAILTLLVVLAFEFFYPQEGLALTLLEFSELSALLVLFIDLAVNFSRAENKIKFLRYNWFEILIFLPFLFVFRAFRIYELFQVMGLEAMPFLMRSEVIVKGGHVAARISRSEPIRLAKRACIELISAPDRYRTVKYRGLLNF